MISLRDPQCSFGMRLLNYSNPCRQNFYFPLARPTFYTAFPAIHPFLPDLFSSFSLYLPNSHSFCKISRLFFHCTVFLPTTRRFYRLHQVFRVFSLGEIGKIPDSSKFSKTSQFLRFSSPKQGTFFFFSNNGWRSGKRIGTKASGGDDFQLGV